MLGKIALGMGGLCLLYLLLLMATDFNDGLGLFSLAGAFGAAVVGNLLLAVAQHLDRQDEIAQALRAIARQLHSDAVEVELEPISAPVDGPAAMRSGAAHASR
ncbi:hypothetical protein [Roseisolibacter agri]|uniref:Uncharacterized protein n=1 Tax=Roseisolibacter agri TaxID=2014610 RepID=A0AA37Q5K3_9BACT|nr:hypothetical protein [Roseisolibacter agri]GLC26739.1 hypothetical protein rosag_32520 [Roseisolibacter agri]